MPSSHSYDYIITGSGAAGLSLLLHMLKDPQLSERRILLVDRERKESNDRTWCFWEQGSGLFEEIVHRRWNRLWFHGHGDDGGAAADASGSGQSSNDAYSKLLEIKPYQYKLIRGIDFYRYAFEIISRHPNVEHRVAEVKEVGRDEAGAFALVDGSRIHATYVFNSILFYPPVMKRDEIMLLQHFKGWLIDTPGPAFNPGEATLMDFRVSQEHGTAFVYVMPFSETRALVEYTLFTEHLLSDELYDKSLRDYIVDYLKIPKYEVAEVEKNFIPMTNYRFPAGVGSLVHIGTAGGQTRGSSGYTFRFIQEHSAFIVEQLRHGRSPIAPYDRRQKRFGFYDSVLLDVLKNDRVPGAKVFTQLFRKNDAAKVLRFLDKQSSLLQDLSVISSLPVWPFLKASVRYF